MSVKVTPATPRHLELHTQLAQRLDGMASSLARVRDGGNVISPEDAAVLHRHVKEAAREARAIGNAKPAAALPKKNPVVQPAYRLLTRLETDIGTVREALLERLHEDEADPNGWFAKKLAEMAASIEQAGNLVAGRGMQS